MAPTKHRSGHLLLCVTAALVLFAIKGTAAGALSLSLTSELRKLGPAAMTLQSDRTYDFSGRVLRCQPNEDVGIIAESHGSLTVSNVTIDGCHVGIITSGSSVRLERVTVQATNGVCIVLGGANNVAVNNVASGCLYGMAVVSNGNRILQNQFDDNVVDGLIIMGDDNLVEGNEALRNGGSGIHIVRMVAMVGENQFVPLIQDRATRNVIRGNKALANGLDLEEFGGCDEPIPFNSWVDNVFNIARPDCVH
jgi:Right handed beta helix region